MIDPKNPDCSIKPGDRARSHDFPHRLLDEDEREPCFYEGKVIRILPRGQVMTFTNEEGELEPVRFPDCDRYVIAVERRVFAGEDRRSMTPHVFPPVNGTPTMGLFGADRTFGVEKLLPLAKA